MTEATHNKLPAQLAGLQTWLLWQLKPPTGTQKKPLKIPYYVTGKPRSKTDTPEDLAQLVTYDEAVAAAAKLNNGGQHLKWRIGLAVTPGLVFIDLDGHRIDGQPDTYAQHWLDACPGAIVEVSQSGKGYHLLGLYTGNGAGLPLLDHEIGLEIYHGGRFCAWTGDYLQSPPAEVQDLTAAVDEELSGSGAATERPGKTTTGKFSGPRWDARNEDAAVAALSKKNPDCDYHRWRDTAFAIHDGAHGDDAGLALFTGWSSGLFWGDGLRQSEKFSHDACTSLWGAIRPGQGITRGSVFHPWDAARTTKAARKPTGKAPEPVNVDPPTQATPPPPASPHGDPVKPAGAFTPLSDLSKRARVEVEFPIAGMVSIGATLLVARPKCGKTFFATQMAHALATGSQFLGSNSVAGKTLYIAAEDTLDQFRERSIEVLKLSPAENLLVVDGEGLAGIRKEFEDDTPLDAWLSYVMETEGVRYIVIDTHESAEAIWNGEAMSDARKVSATAGAYQKTRLMEQVAQKHRGFILLLHHTRKRNGKEITDFHELVNMAQTVVAGCATSLVLADHPERDAYNEDDGRRVFARRGRYGKEFVLALDFQETGFVSQGSYAQVEQKEKQSSLLATLEALQGTGSEFVSVAELASEMDRKPQTIKNLLGVISKSATLSLWKGRKVETKRGPGGGVRLV